MGKTEQKLAEEVCEYVMDTNEYSGVAMEIALKEDDGFVRILADPDDEEILGCHIVEPDASTLIHEIVIAVTSGSGIILDSRTRFIYHPALNEVVERALGNV